MSLRNLHPYSRQLPFAGKPDTIEFSGESFRAYWQGFTDCSDPECPKTYAPLWIFAHTTCCPLGTPSLVVEVYQGSVARRRYKSDLIILSFQDNTLTYVPIDECEGFGYSHSLMEYQSWLDATNLISLEGFTLEQTTFWDFENVCPNAEEDDDVSLTSWSYYMVAEIPVFTGIATALQVTGAVTSQFLIGPFPLSFPGDYEGTPIVYDKLEFTDFYSITVVNDVPAYYVVEVVGTSINYTIRFPELDNQPYEEEGGFITIGVTPDGLTHEISAQGQNGIFNCGYDGELSSYNSTWGYQLWVTDGNGFNRKYTEYNPVPFTCDQFEVLPPDQPQQPITIIFYLVLTAAVNLGTFNFRYIKRNKYTDEVIEQIDIPIARLVAGLQIAKIEVFRIQVDDPDFANLVLKVTNGIFVQTLFGELYNFSVSVVFVGPVGIAIGRLLTLSIKAEVENVNT